MQGSACGGWVWCGDMVPGAARAANHGRAAAPTTPSMTACPAGRLAPGGRAAAADRHGTFAIAGTLPMKEMGLILGTAVLLDAFLIRLVLVPATLYIIGLVGQILILTSFYLVMPLGKLSFRHALIGGITAGLLWEVVRHLLVWYFSTLSVVSLVYGSLATAIVFLLSLEIAGLILLFGAQVIAEFERFRPDEPNVEGIHD